jgi:hypothetical protein
MLASPMILDTGSPRVSRAGTQQEHSRSQNCLRLFRGTLMKKKKKERKKKEKTKQ